MHCRICVSGRGIDGRESWLVCPGASSTMPWPEHHRRAHALGLLIADCCVLRYYRVVLAAPMCGERLLVAEPVRLPQCCCGPVQQALESSLIVASQGWSPSLMALGVAFIYVVRMGESLNG